MDLFRLRVNVAGVSIVYFLVSNSIISIFSCHEQHLICMCTCPCESRDGMLEKTNPLRGSVPLGFHGDSLPHQAYTNCWRVGVCRLSIPSGAICLVSL